MVLLMSIKSFSQNNYDEPIILIDSNNVEMLAFTVEQLDIIKKTLVIAGLNKKRVKELNKKTDKLENIIKLSKQVQDSLSEQYNTCIEISINKDGMIDAKIKIIAEKDSVIAKYKKINLLNGDIVSEKDEIIEALKSKIAKKNKTIIGLIIIDILIVLIVVL